MTDYVIYIFLGICVVIIATLGLVLLHNRRIEHINVHESVNNRGRNRFYIFYKLFLHTPIINKVFRKVLHNTESVYPANVMAINREATKTMLKSTGLSAAIVIAVIIISRGDIWYMMMGITASFVMFHYSLTSNFQKKEYALLDQLKEFLSCVRYHYMNKPIIEDAIEDTLDEIPYEISLHIMRIHEILISPIMDEKTEEYTSTAPNRFLLLLLSICTSSKEYNNGENSFLEALSYLEEEINVEKLKLDSIKHEFATLMGICLSSIFLIKPAELWAKTNMPDTAPFYDGMIGKIVMVAVFVVAIIAYYMISALKETRRSDIVEYNIFSRIANLPVISPILNKVINAKYNKAIIVNETMKEIGDQTGPKALRAKQIVFAIVTFVFIFFSLIYYTVDSRIHYIDKFEAEFDSEIVPNDKYRQIMQDTATDMAERYKSKSVSSIDEEELTREILLSGNVYNEEYARLIAEASIEAISGYKNTYFKWYFLAIALGLAVVAYYIPYWFILFKKKISNMNAEEEVNQFQTLILVLMNADGIQIDDILEWMERFSYTFKTGIEECVLNLESGERKALETLKYSTINKSFQRFIDCLMAIEESDIKTAFAKTVVDREYSIDERKLKNTHMIENRSTIARFLSYAPLLFLAICYLIVPMGKLAIEMYNMMSLSI